MGVVLINILVPQLGPPNKNLWPHPFCESVQNINSKTFPHPKRIKKVNPNPFKKKNSKPLLLGLGWVEKPIKPNPFVLIYNPEIYVLYIFEILKIRT